ncbi:hypothetical protein [Bacillus sp. EAC]|uniref:hypothetical protein n=1 Tax=Bacillus sp. EAC TaxID=1978338 RepID=UPI000B43F69E|nr:hypothetical protein [Bacillus sp. EAC]
MFKQLLLSCIIILVITGCSNNVSMNDVFIESMKSDKNVQNYTVLDEKVESKNGYIFYQSKLILPGDDRNQFISLRIYDKQNGGWILKDTASCSEKWNITTEDDGMNIYCGTITNPNYTNVLIDEKQAKIINLKNNQSKAWFSINNNPNSSIIVTSQDGDKVTWHQSK